MATEDYLVRIITADGSVRALACVTTNLVNEASQRNGALPTAAAALGRALTGAALLSALLKSGQRLAIKFEGNGPLKKIVVEGDSNGAVRGYVEAPRVDLPPKDGKLDVASALGKAGILTVSKDLGMEKPYQGIVELHTSEIASDLAYYLAKSEQVPSAVGLGVFVEPDNRVSAAGGFLIQSLIPSEELIARLTERIEKLPAVTELLRRGKTPEELLELIFADIPFTSLEKHWLVLQCSCSRERVEKALTILGREELAALMDTVEPTSVTCEFCRKQFVFSREELACLMEKM
ncbi:MAG: Hsp33 family molecular chaperone HslO [Deltaproteobacteria bacterium]|nr:Hsp33 family molecular chaperone HslO [Deltaproteobacteria bacterium]